MAHFWCLLVLWGICRSGFTRENGSVFADAFAGDVALFEGRRFSSWLRCMMRVP